MSNNIYVLNIVLDIALGITVAEHTYKYVVHKLGFISFVSPIVNDQVFLLCLWFSISFLLFIYFLMGGVSQIAVLRSDPR